MKFTPEFIENLESNEIVVMGTNTEGRHGRGFAKTCLDNDVNS